MFSLNESTPIVIQSETQRIEKTGTTKQALEQLAKDGKVDPLSPKRLLTFRQFVLYLFRLVDEEKRKKREKEMKRKLSYNELYEKSFNYQTGL